MKLSSKANDDLGITKYIVIKNLKTAKVSVMEWPDYSFKNNPYKRIKKGWKIISIKDTLGQAMVTGMINGGLSNN